MKASNPTLTALLLLRLIQQDVNAFTPSFRSIVDTSSPTAQNEIWWSLSAVPFVIEEEDDDDKYFAQPVGVSSAERELRSMKYAPEEAYDNDVDNGTLEFDDDYEDEEYNNGDAEMGDGEYFHNYLEDDYDEDMEPQDSVPQTGNFWANPRPGLDQIPSTRAQQRRDRRLPPSTATPHRRKPRNPGSRTTFRSGTPAPPGPVKDFYDRLFWYGMDEEDGDWVPQSYDKTVFGGTRGKFNALAYLEDGYDVRPPPRRIKRRLPSSSEEDFEDTTQFDNDDGASLPNREYRSRSDDYRQLRKPRPTRNRKEQSYADIDGSSRRERPRTNGDRIGDEIASWFGHDDISMDDDQSWLGHDDQLPRSTRQRRQNSSSNPIANFLDGLLDVDREDMAMRADQYERNVGRRRSQAQQNAIRSPREAVWTNDEEIYDEAINDKDATIVDIEVEEEPTITKETQDLQSKERMSWEERSRRLERVPPAGIPAWGPSGDLGVDVRTHALLNAMEELREARDRLKAKTERTILARDDIVILRADAALEEKKRDANPRRARERLRYIQMDIEDAARNLRKAQSAERRAQMQVEALEDKHWAVLSLYDPEKASREVEESLVELSLCEPATRRKSSANDDNQQSSP